MLVVRSVYALGRRMAIAAGLGAALLVSAVPAANAASPQLVITSPAAASTTNDTTPVISGETGPLGAFIWCETTISIYEGEDTEAPPLQTLKAPEGECIWVSLPAAALESGTYTAVARGIGGWIEGAEWKEEE